MMVDISLSWPNIILLFPMIAILAFLLVVVSPWVYSKVSAPFFGGGQMDRRGPGPTFGRRLPKSSSNSDSHHHHSTTSSSRHSGHGSIFGSYGNDYRSDPTNYGSDDYDQHIYHDPTHQEFADDDSDDDDAEEEDDDDDDDDDD